MAGDEEYGEDEGVLIFFLLVPLAYPLLYSWIYNNEVVRDVPVAIVDLSHSAASREFIRSFDASPDVRAAYYCNNLQEAKDLVGHQAVRAFCTFLRTSTGHWDVENRRMWVFIVT